MSQLRNKVPLGAVLQQAGLVSSQRLQEALKEQKQISPNVRIGEILAAKGYINAKTANFFAEEWTDLVKEGEKQPIGQYLKQAALLDEQQIIAILAEQKEKQNKLKFGEIAIAKGWIQKRTIDFFVRYITGENLERANIAQKIFRDIPRSHNSNVLEEKAVIPDFSPYSTHGKQSFLGIKLKLLNIHNQDDFSEAVLNRVLWWSGGQSFLSKKILEIASKPENHQSVVQKPDKIDDIVQKHLIESWQSKDVSKHFQTIKKRLICNQQSEPERLLRLYKQVFNENVPIEESQDQQQLLKSGLVVRQQNKLAVANPIYRSVFDLKWVEQELNLLESPETSSLTIVPTNSSAVVKVSKKSQRSSKLRNSLLLLAFITLLTVLFGTIAKRVAIRSAFSRGNELLRQKSFEQAVEEYNSLLNKDSNYFQAWTNRGYALAGMGEYEQMRESCSTATIIEPTAVYAWNCLGEALHNLKQEEKAIAAFDRAIELNSNDSIFLINKSESLKSLGKSQESLAMTQKAIKVLEKMETIEGRDKVKGEFAVALTFLGNSYRQNQQYAIAVDSYNRALEYSPNYFPAQIGKGIVLNKIQRYQEAQQEYRSILQNNSQLSLTQQAQTWFYLGKSLCQSQQNNAGIAALEKAIKLKTEYEAAKNAIANCK